MKKLSFLVAVFLGILSLQSLSARDMTYKFSAGYRQAFTNGFVDEKTKLLLPEEQLNGLEASYGLARDIQAGVFFGFAGNFNRCLLGPKLRFDIERLVSRDLSIWNNLNIFAELAFLAKFGGDVKGGITMHVPTLGFEVLPFTSNNFAILTSAGLTVDVVEKNRFGFTNGMFGDVGVRYYF